MATFNVSTIDDLVAKIKLANTNGQDDEIILAAGTYDISAYTGTRDNDFDSRVNLVTVTNALPVIKTSITIRGVSADTTIITRNGTTNHRLFHVAAGASLTLRKLTLSKGNVGIQDVGGGAVEVLGTAVFEDCRLGPDNKSNYGGAIINREGNVTIRRCDIFNNEADWGGGVYNYDQGVMWIYDTRIANNKAMLNDGGLYYAGGVYNSNSLVIDHCCIVENQAQRGGGVMSNRGVALTTIKRSIISRNNAFEGAGIYSGFGPMNLEDCTLMDNIGSYGRIAYRRDVHPVTLTRCHLPDNYATEANPQQFPNDFWYVVNQNPLPAWRPNFTMVSDGAGGLTPAYQYNRQEAANRAIALSRENFSSFPQDSAATVVGKIENGGTARGRTYASSILDHQTPPPGQPGRTGSSIFISEMLHFGGLPMMIDPSEDLLNPSCTVPNPDTSGGFTTRGWRVCPQAQGDSSLLNWRFHQGIHQFFTSLPGGGDKGLVTVDEISGFIWRDQISRCDAGGTLKPDSANAQNALVAKFATGVLADVATGDYVYIGSHGFIIVGWGPLLATIPGIQHGLGTIAFTKSTTNSIPYVADFCYGTNSTTNPNPDLTDWLQDPRPRPFYATATRVFGASLRSDQVDNLRKTIPDTCGSVLEPTYELFAEIQQNGWRFYKIPDSIKMDSATLPVSRLYFSG
jgi:hypothetical protein